MLLSEKFTTRIIQLKHHLLDRRCLATIIDEQIQKAVSVRRSEALQIRKRSHVIGLLLLLLITLLIPRLPALFRSYLPILHTSSRCKEAIPEPLMVAFCRLTNIFSNQICSEDSFHRSYYKGFLPMKQCATCKKLAWKSQKPTYCF